jgi:hypothetical protein
MGVSHDVITLDDAGNRKPSKRKSSGRIDAGIYNLATYEKEKPASLVMKGRPRPGDARLVAADVV